MKLHSIHINEHVTVIHPPHFVPGEPPVRSMRLLDRRVCVCKICGAEFVRKTNDKTCSFTCREKNKRAQRDKWVVSNPHKNLLLKRAWSKRNKKYEREKIRQWRRDNPDKHRKQSKRRIVNLSDSYIVNNLKLKKEYCPHQLIEAQRANIQLKRLCQSLKTSTSCATNC